MPKGLITVTKPGLYLPDAFRDKITGEYRTRMGYGSVHDGKMETMTLNLNVNEYNVPQALKEVLDTHHANGVVFHFLDAPEGIDEADEQPYPMMTEENEVVIAAFIDSECQNYAKDTGLATPEYWAGKEFLSEFISDLYIQAEGDLGKVYDLLDQAKQRKMIGNILIPRGACTLLIASPDTSKQVITFQNKNTDLQFDAKGWWASRHLGYVETPVQVASGPVAGETKLQQLQREKRERLATKADPSIGAKALAPPTHETETRPKTEGLKSTITEAGKGSVPSVKQGDTITIAMRNGGPIIVPVGTKLVEPPKELHGAGLDNWYKRNFGFKPDNCQSERPALPASWLKRESGLREGLMKLYGWMVLAKPGQTEADVTAEVKEQVTSTQPNGKPAEIRALIPPATNKEIHQRVIKDGPVMSKEEMEIQLAKDPPASEQMGIPFAHMVRLPLKSLRAITSTSAQQAACMMLEMAAFCVKMDPKLLDWKPEEKVEAAAPPSNETKLQQLQREKRERLANLNKDLTTKKSA